MFVVRIRALLLALALASASAIVQAAPPIVQAAPPGAPPQKVDGPELSSLIRMTILALHQANITGNYTVLRDLGANEFQSANTAADLAAQFALFRQKQISLASAVLFDATLDEAPMLSTHGALRVIGHFPTKPQEIVFDLIFLYEAGAWRIDQLSVGTRLPTAAPPSAPAVSPPAATDLIPPTQVPLLHLPTK